MFFQSMNSMMTTDVDITLVIRKSADGRMSVSLMPKANSLKNEAVNNIVPLTLNGMPAEIDAGFMQAVSAPVQKVSGLISNMAQFEAQAEKAAAAGKGKKPKESKEEKEKREKYEKNLKKAQELAAAKKHNEAIDALTEARKYADEENLNKIDAQIDEQKKLTGQGDLFAMMEETMEQPPQNQQPADVQQPSLQYMAGMPQQQPRQMQDRPDMQHRSVPGQAAPQQPYGQPAYGGQHGYAQPQQGWPQQPSQNGGYPQYAHPNDGMMQPERYPQGAYPTGGQHGHEQEPMPLEHDVFSRPAGSVSPDDSPAYRPGEYSEYPDFPTSMLHGNYVQP